jgi:hypothetical protein
VADRMLEDLLHRGPMVSIELDVLCHVVPLGLSGPPPDLALSVDLLTGNIRIRVPKEPPRSLRCQIVGIRQA